MTYNIILSQENNKYLAQVREFPQVTAEASSRYLVLQEIRDYLKKYLTKHVEVVQIELDSPLDEEKQRILDQVGRFADDPTFDDLQDEVAKYRKGLDQEFYSE